LPIYRKNAQFSHEMKYLNGYNKVKPFLSYAFNARQLCSTHRSTGNPIVEE